MSQKPLSSIADHTLIGLKEAREAIGVSQLALANQLEESRATIVRIENGEQVKQSTIYKIISKYIDCYGEKYSHFSPVTDSENKKRIIIEFQTKSVHSSKKSWRDLSNDIMECYVELASKNDKSIFDLIEKLELILKIPPKFNTSIEVKIDPQNTNGTV